MKIMKLQFLFTLTVLLSTDLIAQQKTTYKFSFGPGKEVPGIKKYLIKGLPSFDPSKPDPFEKFSLSLSPHSPVIIID